MELKATSMGKRLAQHPYDKIVLLNAGVKVSGERHEYLFRLISYWPFIVNEGWYGGSWSSSCRQTKWCDSTGPSGRKPNASTII